MKKELAYREIKNIYHKLGGILGHRYMGVFLSRKNISLSETTVHKYMNKELGLLCTTRRKRPEYKKGHVHKIFPNMLKQDFTVKKANQVWCTDFTYSQLTNGFVRYNCSAIDLYDRSIVASETGKWITNELAIRTIKKGLNAQKSYPINLILHSDQSVC